MPFASAQHADGHHDADEQADPAQVLERDDWETQTTRRLSEALKLLDPRSRAIVQRRWLSDDKPTLHDLAAEYQVSAERIRQIEAKALRKLRHPSRSDMLRSFLDGTDTLPLS